jgi:hypothetical protein
MSLAVEKSFKNIQFFYFEKQTKNVRCTMYVSYNPHFCNWNFLLALSC